MAVVEKDDSMTTRMVAVDFNVDYFAIVFCLKKLGKVRKLAGWVLHELTADNETDRVQIFTELLQRNEKTLSLKNFARVMNHGHSSKIPKETKKRK